ncbi:MAG: cytochrome c [Deltaproteobacteria bacterium]|nr:cytochrome c [Deltaproteobacteria bacterium]
MSMLENSRMGRGLAMGLGAVSLTLLLACGGGTEPTGETVVEEDVVVEESAPAPDAAPAGEAAAPTAAAGGAGNADQGKAIYATYCGACHGTGGTGDGPAAATLTTKPRNHTDGAFMNALPNEEIFKAIKEGGASVGKSNLMPAWGATLNDAQIQDVVAFVRSLAVPPYQGQ